MPKSNTMDDYIPSWGEHNLHQRIKKRQASINTMDDWTKNFEILISLAIAGVIEEAGTTPYTVGDIKDRIMPLITAKLEEIDRAAIEDCLWLIDCELDGAETNGHTEAAQTCNNIKRRISGHFNLASLKGGDV